MIGYITIEEQVDADLVETIDAEVTEFRPRPSIEKPQTAAA
jgi:hypothetical protein